MTGEGEVAPELGQLAYVRRLLQIRHYSRVQRQGQRKWGWAEGGEDLFSCRAISF